MSVKDIDKGWKRIKGALSDFNGAYVKIGIQSNEPDREDGTPMALVGAVNEFGSADGRIPERSFLRSTVDENRQKYNNGIAKLRDDVLAGKRTVAQALGLLGERVQADIRKKITDLKDPPNAPSTVVQKGSSNPLIDTGAMRSSVRYEVSK